MSELKVFRNNSLFRRVLGIMLVIMIMITILLTASHRDNNEICNIAIMDTTAKFNDYNICRYLWMNDMEDFDGEDNDRNGYIDDIVGYDFARDNGSVFLESAGSGHATSCIQIMVNSWSDSFYNPNIKCMILHVMKVNNGSTSGNCIDVISAIKYAESHHVKICNMSFSTEVYNKQLYHTMKKSNMLFVVSAGNGKFQGVDIDVSPVFPASWNLKNMIVVANADDTIYHHLAFDSNYGKKTVDIAANGEFYVSFNNRTLKVSGTSYSAAAVSGEAAKIAAFHPKYSSAEIKRALVAGCETSRYLQSMVNNGNYLPIKHAVNANDITYKEVR